MPSETSKNEFSCIFVRKNGKFEHFIKGAFSLLESV